MSYFEAACAGKERYLTAELAWEAAKRRSHTKRMKGKRQADGRKAYRCRYCGGWHMGHNDSKAARARDRAKGLKP